MKPDDLLLEQLQNIDKQIDEEERALLHLNKQVGNKISKIGKLKETRSKVVEAYRQLSIHNNKVEDKNERV